jgi:hypothetical protein
MPTASAPNEANIAQSNNLWTTMTPTEAVEKFFDQNPKRAALMANAVGRPETHGLKRPASSFRLPALLLEQVMYGRPLSTITHDNLVTLDDCFDKLHGPTFRKSPRAIAR